MDLFAFIHVADPTKVKMGERDRAEGEKILLASTGDSAASGGHNVVIEPVADVEDTAAENLTFERPKHHRNKRPAYLPRQNVRVVTLRSVTGTNPRTIGPAERFVKSPDYSHHSSTNASGVKVDSVIRSADPLLMIIEAVINTTTASAPSIHIPEVAAKITPMVQHSIYTRGIQP
nr:hypothetical protein [Tanacetum cinerariifolium]